MWIVPFHFWKSTDRCAIKKILFYSISLSSFITLSSLSFFFFFLSSPQFIFSVLTSLPFFFFFFLSPEPQPLLFSCFFFPLFLFSVTFYAPSLSFFFPCHSPSLSFFFSPLRSLPLRSATVVEFGLAVEFNLTNKVVAVEISYSDLPLFFFFFFFFFCGFWIWNLLEDLVIVVVVCGSCCNGGCWFLVGGGCH